MALTNINRLRSMTSQPHSKFAWADMLYRYDRGEFGVANNCGPNEIIEHLTIDEALAHVSNLKIGLGEQANNLFGQLPNESKLQSILGAIQQTFGNDYLYPSIVEQAAQLLYFVIKDHPFIDGNKRIAVELCTQFLKKNKFIPHNNNFDHFYLNLAFQALYVAFGKDQQELAISVVKEFLILNLHYDSKL
jgi:prophage maintenance system killer protein